MSSIEQGEIVGMQAWNSHELSKQASKVDEWEINLMADDLVGVLAEYAGPPQPEQGMNVDFYPQNSGLPRVGMLLRFAAVDKLLGSAGVKGITFETHPEWTMTEGAATRKWLKVGGDHPENTGGGMWETMFVIGDFAVRKLGREKSVSGCEYEEQLLELADVKLLTSVLGGARETVKSLQLR